jgi:enamine deaminase RidA (YjgF/YER057c/UK114 family)
MSLKFVNPSAAPPPDAGYRHLAIVPAGRRLLVLAGQIGNRLDGSLAEGLDAQYEQALANIATIVASEGGTSADIARITCFLVEKPVDLTRIVTANGRTFPDGPPAITWIYVAGLFRPEIKVEIEAIAAVV